MILVDHVKRSISEDCLPFRRPTHCSLFDISSAKRTYNRRRHGPRLQDLALVGGQERDSMEVRIGKADFLEVEIGSDQWRTAVKARNCVPRAVEQGYKPGQSRV